MGEHTKIQWCDHTFNPVRGCTKVSPGCLNCYAEKIVVNRLGGEWGANGRRDIAAESKWREPLKWNKAAGDVEAFHRSETPLHDEGELAPYVRPRVFCASLADWLDHEWPLAARVRLLNLIESTPNLDWLLLTKRPRSWHARMLECASQSKLAALWVNGEAPANVWLGTSVEDQTRADERIPELLAIPARVRFLSMEPLLGPVDLTRVDEDPSGRLDALAGLTFCKGRNEPAKHASLDWVIVGGESGPGARETCIDHIEDVVIQCDSADVPVFVKQLGAVPFTTNANRYDWDVGVMLEAHGTEAAGARLVVTDRKGGDMSEWPEQLQIRDFPTVP